jgi:hypothetical protein
MYPKKSEQRDLKTTGQQDRKNTTTSSTYTSTTGLKKKENRTKYFHDHKSKKHQDKIQKKVRTTGPYEPLDQKDQTFSGKYTKDQKRQHGRSKKR